MRAQLPLRLTRSAAFAAVGVGLAALAHTMAGGAAPTPGFFCLSLAAVMALGTILSGRERTPATINTVLIATQLALHTAFGYDSGPAVLSPLTDPEHGLGQNTGMLLTHLIATLLTGWWLARGEGALWSLLRRLGRRLVLLLVCAAPAEVRQAAFFTSRRVPVCPAVTLTVSRRGPPLPA
ncbi:MFS transporter [Nonomuraea endophytica]|uniref:MFS transporter n=1 Tax=Nonomuraea endophytica TaxID=714136 RepID=UPI0037C65F70